jgi:4-azaleucine resistance transporter AzlC
VAAIPFGIIFGTLSASSGLSLAGAVAMSALVFAGSSQFIALGLLASGSSGLVIVLTTFVVNLRHLLYAVSLLPYVKSLPQRWRIPLAFWLTDEAFAVAMQRYFSQDYSPHKHWYHLGSSVAMYLDWQLGTWVGLMLGNSIADASQWGLDFAMSVTFIGMTIPYLKNRPTLTAVMVAAALSLLTYPLPHKLGLMVSAMGGIGAGFLAERCWINAPPLQP